MKKALLIYRINRDDPGNAGVIKKCLAQADAFRKLGLEVDMFWLCKDGVLLNNVLVLKKRLIPHSYSIYWFYFFQFGALISKLVDITNYDLIYLRHPFFDPLLVRFLKNVKKRAPKLKTVLEINAYPYDDEPKRLLHQLSLKMDQYYRKNAHQFIDAIAHYGMEKEIWSIPSIPIRNGIDVDKIKVSKSIPKTDKLRLIAVGNWSYWHGLDRLIKGMKEYYERGEIKTEISLLIIGEKANKVGLKKLVMDLGLEEKVKFSPPKTNEKLDQLFDEADIGVGNLGMHRTDIQLSSSLKHREYCSRGIPFILAANDPDFSKRLRFVKRFPSNETPIDCGQLVKFQKAILEKNDHFKTELRAFAEVNLSWNIQMKKVLDFFK